MDCESSTIPSRGEEFNTEQDAEGKKENGTQQPVTKDRKTGRVEEGARDHPVRMTGATEREEKRRER